MQAEVSNLLRKLNLAKYVGLFSREEIDMSALRNMNDADFQALGLPMGPRKKLMAALKGKGGL
eukprot:scaffold4182_cov384-Prasinococcus_capsulatus_cf.AAC.7